MDEPTRGSVVVTEGPTGTAWQRHHSDGLWHSTNGITAKWDRVENKEPLVVYAAPVRAHDDHEIRYVEDRISRSYPATITADGDVMIDAENAETDFLTDTETHVWCSTCNLMLTPANSGLDDEWNVR